MLPAHLTEHSFVPSLPACPSVLPPAPRELPPPTGQRPDSEGGLWPFLCPHSSVCTSVWCSGVCPGCGGGACAHVTPGPHSPVPTSACIVSVSVTEHRWCLQCHFLFFSSLTAMDGVPFMISEKFSCVPESVSVLHDGPLVRPPPACVPSARPAGPCPRVVPRTGLPLWAPPANAAHSRGSRSDRRVGMRHGEGARQTSGQTPIQP